MTMGRTDGLTAAVSMLMMLALPMFPQALPHVVADAAAVSAPAPPAPPMTPAVAMPSVAIMIMKRLLVVTAGPRALESGESRSTPLSPGPGTPAHTAERAEAVRVLMTRLRK